MDILLPPQEFYLNDLVWSLVLEDLLIIDQSSLLSAANTCRQLYVLAVPFIYRKIHLRGRTKGSDYLLRRLTRHDSRLPVFIRDIVIDQGSWLDEGTLELLVKLILKSKCLETLSWSGTYDILQPILDRLEQSRPGTRLTVHAQMAPSQTLNLAGLQRYYAGLSSPYLHSLKCHFPQEPEAQLIARLCFFKTLKSSPNLRKLTIEKESVGCVIYGWDANDDVRLDVHPEDQLPLLEELSFPMNSTDTIFSMADLIKWGDMGGWMNLRRLNIKNMMILPAFAGRVPSLRSIQADVPWNDLQLQKSRFCELGSLEELTLDGDGMKIPLDILEAYSGTLTSLSVHTPELYHPERRPDISLGDLELLRRICPRLKTLGIDMNREGKWPHAFLLELAKFPSLTHLTLSAEGRRGGKPAVLPIIDKDSSEYLFDFLRTHKTGQPLLSLTIQRGVMVSSWDGDYFGFNVIDEWNYSARFECRLDSRGDLSVTQIGGETLQGVAGKRLRDMDKWDVERWGSPFSGYDERELGILARLLDYEWAKERLVSAGLLDGVEGEREEVRQFGEKTGRLLTAFKQVSGENRVEYQRQLKEELVKVRRKRLMEEAFPDDCTLYDVLRGGE